MHGTNMKKKLTLRLHLLLSHDLLCEYHYYLIMWQQPVLEVPSNISLSFEEKVP